MVGPGDLKAWLKDPARRKRGAANAFIATILFIFILDSIPAYFPPHKELQRRLDPLVDITGLWQGTWKLFAPSPDKENTYVSAEIRFEDGSTHAWRSPHWGGMGAGQKIRAFRHMEYWDSVRMNDNRRAWDALGDYLARVEGKKANPTSKVTEVMLTRHWATIPAPRVGLFERIEVGPLKYKRYLFHVWKAAP
jgi:hypothetical protein